jgi:ectoine hydroxylase-related dioxygenase (phytanoyl-CoA dioxygenase family)
MSSSLLRFDCQGEKGIDLAKAGAIRGAYDCFVKQGYAILDNVVAADKIAALIGEFDAQYADYYSAKPVGELMTVGDRRMMIPVDLSGALSDPALFANPYVVALIRELLGHDAVLEAFGAIVSLAGAERQHVHRDASPLFDAGISTILPAHALTVAFPLIEMNDVHGTTTIWTGSHRRPLKPEQPSTDEPVVPAGSCFMWDFRTWHSGTPNRSHRQRPMLYAVYARPWYKDPGNYGKGVSRRLSFPKGFIENLPEDQRRLFAKG